MININQKLDYLDRLLQLPISKDKEVRITTLLDSIDKDLELQATGGFVRTEKINVTTWSDPVEKEITVSFDDGAIAKKLGEAVKKAVQSVQDLKPIEIKIDGAKLAEAIKPKDVKPEPIGGVFLYPNGKPIRQINGDLPESVKVCEDCGVVEGYQYPHLKDCSVRKRLIEELKTMSTAGTIIPVNPLIPKSVLKTDTPKEPTIWFAALSIVGLSLFWALFFWLIANI